MEQQEDVVKVLLELAGDIDKADKVIQTYYPSCTLENKVKLLKSMYNIEIIGHENDKPTQDTYNSILQVIVEKRYL